MERATRAERDAAQEVVVTLLIFQLLMGLLKEAASRNIPARANVPGVLRGGGSGDLKGRRELAQLVSVTLLMSQLLIGWSNLAAPDGEHPCTREGSDDGGSLSRAEDHLTADHLGWF